MVSTKPAARGGLPIIIEKDGFRYVRPRPGLQLLPEKADDLSGARKHAARFCVSAALPCLVQSDFSEKIQVPAADMIKDDPATSTFSQSDKVNDNKGCLLRTHPDYAKVLNDLIALSGPQRSCTKKGTSSSSENVFKDTDSRTGSLIFEELRSFVAPLVGITEQAELLHSLDVPHCKLLREVIELRTFELDVLDLLRGMGNGLRFLHDGAQIPYGCLNSETVALELVRADHVFGGFPDAVEEVEEAPGGGAAGQGEDVISWAMLLEDLQLERSSAARELARREKSHQTRRRNDVSAEELMSAQQISSPPVTAGATTVTARTEEEEKGSLLSSKSPLIRPGPDHSATRAAQGKKDSCRVGVAAATLDKDIARVLAEPPATEKTTRISREVDTNECKSVEVEARFDAPVGSATTPRLKAGDSSGSSNDRKQKIASPLLAPRTALGKTDISGWAASQTSQQQSSAAQLPFVFTHNSMSQHESLAGRSTAPLRLPAEAEDAARKVERHVGSRLFEETKSLMSTSLQKLEDEKLQADLKRKFRTTTTTMVRLFGESKSALNEIFLGPFDGAEVAPSKTETKDEIESKTESEGTSKVKIPDNRQNKVSGSQQHHDRKQIATVQYNEENDVTETRRCGDHVEQPTHAVIDTVLPTSARLQPGASLTEGKHASADACGGVGVETEGPQMQDSPSLVQSPSDETLSQGKRQQPRNKDAVEFFPDVDALFSFDDLENPFADEPSLSNDVLEPQRITADDNSINLLAPRHYSRTADNSLRNKEASEFVSPDDADTTCEGQRKPEEINVATAQIENLATLPDSFYELEVGGDKATYSEAEARDNSAYQENSVPPGHRGSESQETESVGPTSKTKRDARDGGDEKWSDQDKSIVNALYVAADQSFALTSNEAVAQTRSSRLPTADEQTSGPTLPRPEQQHHSSSRRTNLPRGLKLVPRLLQPGFAWWLEPPPLPGAQKHDVLQGPQSSDCGTMYSQEMQEEKDHKEEGRHRAADVKKEELAASSLQRVVLEKVVESRRCTNLTLRMCAAMKAERSSVDPRCLPPEVFGCPHEPRLLSEPQYIDSWGLGLLGFELLLGKKAFADYSTTMLAHRFIRGIQTPDRDTITDLVEEEIFSPICQTLRHYLESDTTAWRAGAGVEAISSLTRLLTETPKLLWQAEESLEPSILNLAAALRPGPHSKKARDGLLTGCVLVPYLLKARPRMAPFLDHKLATLMKGTAGLAL
ncbi:unnamed protein product [Amoebophrya sp. A120]|nr:unnamed protein product [Amoebophrya sp. A120]|eukprot:GSA120T00015219001.1